uniref:EF-hand domain-containing protein n=1 Tax=Oryza brachyantha TaxID=4533 RepID=J3LGT9_ORYBR
GARQKHVAFFDSDHDGIISFSETYEGFRALGFGFVTSKLSAACINGALGPKTRPENATTSLFSIYVENIHKGVHGSDTRVYDSEGRFVDEKFDEIFTKHAKTVPDGLTFDELGEMVRANREPKDYKGWIGAWTEWRRRTSSPRTVTASFAGTTSELSTMEASSVNWRRRRWVPLQT